MKFLQINLNHCEVARSLLEQSVIEKNVDKALISEQYRNNNFEEWVANNNKKSAIWSCGSPRRHISRKKGENFFARAHVNGIAFYSCYLPPSIPRQYLRSTRLQKTPKHPQAISALDEIAEGARENHPAVIAGDYNAWATEWGPPRTNARGKALLQSFALDLVLLNSGTKPTFSRAGTSL